MSEVTASITRRISKTRSMHAWHACIQASREIKRTWSDEIGKASPQPSVGTRRTAVHVCIFPPHSLAVKMQGRGSLPKNFDPPSTPFIWRERTYERNKRVKQVRRSMFGKVVRPSRYRPLTRRSWISRENYWLEGESRELIVDYYWWEGLTA